MSDQDLNTNVSSYSRTTTLRHQLARSWTISIYTPSQAT